MCQMVIVFISIQSSHCFSFAKQVKVSDAKPGVIWTVATSEDPTH